MPKGSGSGGGSGAVVLQFQTRGAVQASNQIKGLATRFVGLQAALAFAQKSLNDLMGWVKESINEFRKFEKSMAEVSTILQGQAYEDLPALTAGVENLSKKYGKAAEDVASGLYDILSAAVDSKDAINLLNVATKASVAGLTSVEVAVDVMTSVMNSYGKSVFQATQISDILFQTVIRGKLKFEDLASAMGYITPIAAAAGVAFEEVAATLATVTRQGLRVDMASRGLALLIQGIVNPTKQASDAAGEYDVEMNSLALSVKGLEGFFYDLRDAIEQFGSQIIPEMVRNMRSFRVVMAAVSNEGIAGFTKDLGLMQQATGKTEEALAKMLNTSQQRVDMLTESMNYLERSIGDTWSGFDIWIKKAQLWWGTALVGGDAGKALKDYNTFVYEYKKNAIDLQKTMADYENKPTLFSALMGEDTEGGMESQLKHLNDFGKVSEHFANMRDKQAKVDERNKKQSIKDLKDLAIAKYEAGEMSQKEIESYFYGAQKPVYKDGKIDYADYDPTWQLSGAQDLEDAAAGGGDAMQNVRIASNELGTEINSLDDDIKLLDQELANTEVYFNYFNAGIDDAEDAISEFKMNVLKLENAIADLKYEVEDTYKSMGGQGEYAGRMAWEIDVAKSERDIDRVTTYIGMASKYGGDYLNNLSGDVKDYVTTIYEYTESQKKAADATKEYNDALKLLSIQMMEIQLKGMGRRRGLTRSEERQIKKLQIEQMKERLAMAKDESIALADAENEGYNDAVDFLRKYIDEEQHNIWLLKDTRDQDIADMELMYKNKKDQLGKYRTWKKEENEKLEIAEAAHFVMLKGVNAALADDYQQTYGIDIPASYEAAITARAEWREEHYPEGDQFGGTTPNLNPLQQLVADRLPILADYMNSNRQRGGLIPSAGMYMLHSGETVSPRGKETGGGNIVVNVTTNVANVSSNMDINNIAKTNARIVAAELSGKYGMR